MCNWQCRKMNQNIKPYVDGKTIVKGAFYQTKSVLTTRYD